MATNRKRQKWAASRAAVMASMRPNHTYAEIGKHFGVTYERVRQILKKHGYKEAIGWANKHRTKICEQCGFEIRAPIKKVTPKTRFCSRFCNSAYISSHMTARERELVVFSVALRIQGKPWREIAETLRYSTGEIGTSLAREVKRMAAKENIDVSAAYGFYARGARWQQRWGPNV